VTGEVAVPLALFIVETLTNVFRYAFPMERSGCAVSVRLKRREDGGCILAIEDNGIGFAAGSVKSGIGDRLMKVFGRQVGGTVSVDSQHDRGTRVELIFAVTGEQAPRLRATVTPRSESKAAAPP
jgi:two-component sensor histidine kinase